jgi:serine/threonine protein kinase
MIWKPVQHKYKIKEKLGKGAFGAVILAENRESGQLVAIKMIKDISKDSYMTRKVLREVKILRKLS